MNDDRGKLVLALLEEARQQGRRDLLRTALIKFLYLTDYYYCQETGRTWTGWEWRFVHFGPFALAAVHLLEDLVRCGDVLEAKSQSKTEDKEFILYSLARRGENLVLRDLDIPAGAAINIRADLKRYGGKLADLLDYVYFHTTPMESAKPGQILEFTRCTKLSKDDFRPIEMKQISPKAIRRARERVRELIRQSDSTQRPEPEGQFDDVYFAGVAELEGEPIPTGLTGRADIVDIKVD